MPSRYDDTLPLVAAAQRGDDDAADALFARYLPVVRQIVSYRLGCRARDLALQDDLVQEALLRVFQNLHKFSEQSEATFRNWVSTCVANSVRNQLRDARAQVRGGGNVRNFGALESTDLTLGIFADGPGPSTVFRGQELFERIEKSLLEMQDHHREAILLRKFCGMTYEEVAAAMGIGEEATARKVFSRALKVLREKIELD